MVNQGVLGNLWESLDTPIFRMESGGCANEIRAYCREVENDVWLYKDAGSYQLFNDMPSAHKGYGWKECLRCEPIRDNVPGGAEVTENTIEKTDSTEQSRQQRQSEKPQINAERWARDMGYRSW